MLNNFPSATNELKIMRTGRCLLILKLLLECFAKPKDYLTDSDIFHIFPWY